jgi:ABC-type sugar transport system ATPase subunit
MRPSAAVRVRGVVKSFAGVQALRGVDFELVRGELHGLVGENGAGKSTLAKIISGAYATDQGTLWANDVQLAHGNPRAHADAGIAMVYQEPKLVPNLTAADNVFLGKGFHHGPFVARGLAIRRLSEIAGVVGIDIDPTVKAGELTLAKQRMLDVIRGLDSGAEVLIMDEPSAALGPVERDSLYRTIERLRQNKVTILYISHDLDEVFRLSDRITVMRDGEIVATHDASQWTPKALVEAMLGRDFVVPTRHRSDHGTAGAEEILRVEGLAVPGALQRIDLSLRKGEVLGIAGLVGSGRSSLLRALAGGEPRAAGKLVLDGKEVRWPVTVRRALGYGIAFSPEDRRRYGLVLGLSGAVNVALTNTHAVSEGSFIRMRKLLRYAAELMTPLAFNPARLKVTAGLLSGGNQQKLVVGRTLGSKPGILLLDEPTAGIDIGAKAEMFTIIDQLAAEGLSVLFASSELEEVVEISDRILVIGRGRSLGVLEDENCTVQKILELAFGVEHENEAA